MTTCAPARRSAPFHPASLVSATRSGLSDAPHPTWLRIVDRSSTAMGSAVATRVLAIPTNNTTDRIDDLAPQLGVQFLPKQICSTGCNSIAFGATPF